MTATPRIPVPANEPVLSYAPGTSERVELKKALKDLSSHQLEIPLVIGGKEVRTGKTVDAVMPHCHHHVLAKVHQAGPAEVQAAIKAAGEAWHDRSEEHTSELQSRLHLVCRLLLEKKKTPTRRIALESPVSRT